MGRAARPDRQDRRRQPRDEVKPWCAGIESGDATGWPATDWMEDIILRTAGPETYDKWVSPRDPVQRPRHRRRPSPRRKILKNDEVRQRWLRRRQDIASTSFQDGGRRSSTGRATCTARRRSTRPTSPRAPRSPRTVTSGPSTSRPRRADKPVLVGGEFIAAFADRPEVKAFQTYLSSVEWANERAKTCGLGGCVTANKNADPSLDRTRWTSCPPRSSPTRRRRPVRRLRPHAGRRGSGTFWKGMTDWITGKDDKATLDYIEQSWPKSLTSPDLIPRTRSPEPGWGGSLPPPPRSPSSPLHRRWSQ